MATATTAVDRRVLALKGDMWSCEPNQLATQKSSEKEKNCLRLAFEVGHLPLTLSYLTTATTKPSDWVFCDNEWEFCDLENQSHSSTTKNQHTPHSTDFSNELESWELLDFSSASLNPTVDQTQETLSVRVSSSDSRRKQFIKENFFYWTTYEMDLSHDNPLQKLANVVNEAKTNHLHLSFPNSKGIEQTTCLCGHTGKATLNVRIINDTFVFIPNQKGLLVLNREQNQDLSTCLI